MSQQKQVFDPHATSFPFATNSQSVHQHERAYLMPNNEAFRQRAQSVHACYNANNMCFPTEHFAFGKRSASEILSRPIVLRDKRSKIAADQLKKGTWSQDEDLLLVSLLHEYPGARWSDIAGMVPGRSAKQCRERWSCNLDPNINKRKWTVDEDKLILSWQKKLGNRWAQIAMYLPGRTENAVKTRYKSIIRATKREWSREEDALIMKLQRDHGSNWELISSELPNRTKNAVKTRYRLLIKGKVYKPPEPGAPNQILYNSQVETEYPSNPHQFANAQIHMQGSTALESKEELMTDFLNGLDGFEHLYEREEYFTATTTDPTSFQILSEIKLDIPENGFQNHETTEPYTF